MSRIIKICLGSVLLTIGVVGIVFPILPGWVFFFLGMLILTAEIPLFARVLCWAEGRHPASRKLIGRLRARLHRYGIHTPSFSADPPEKR